MRGRGEKYSSSKGDHVLSYTGMKVRQILKEGITRHLSPRPKLLSMEMVSEGAVWSLLPEFVSHLNPPWTQLFRGVGINAERGVSQCGKYTLLYKYSTPY